MDSVPHSRTIRNCTSFDLQGFTRLTLSRTPLIQLSFPPYYLFLSDIGRGQMFFGDRKQFRTDERFLVLISSVYDPLVTELASVEDQSPTGVRLATQQSWELGTHVDLKPVAGDLTARARVVYCHALGLKKFVVGLNILSRDGDHPSR